MFLLMRQLLLMLALVGLSCRRRRRRMRRQVWLHQRADFTGVSICAASPRMSSFAAGPRRHPALAIGHGAATTKEGGEGREGKGRRGTTPATVATQTTARKEGEARLATSTHQRELVGVCIIVRCNRSTPSRLLLFPHTPTPPHCSFCWLNERGVAGSDRWCDCAWRRSLWTHLL